MKKIHPSWLIVAISIMIIIVMIATQVLGLSKSKLTIDFLTSFYGKNITVSGKIAKDPTTESKKTSFQITEISAMDTYLSGKIYISTYSDVEFERGDEIIINGKIEKGFGNFVGSIKNSTIMEIKKNDDAFLKVRKVISKKIKQHVGAEAGLLLGYLLGQKSEIDPELEDALRIVGLTHIIVASGTHLGILVSFGRKIFGKISRFAGFLSAGILIVIFVGITGLTPSMTRAAFVSLLSLVAWYFGRDTAAWRTLLYAAAVTLFIDPENLVELAWQLSFGSFFGLMILSPIFTRYFYGEREPGFLGSSLITSFSTILCCAPILIYNFGAISLISILANLLILPTIAPVMGLGAATGTFGLVGGLFGLIASIFGFLASLILKYHIIIVNFLSSQKSFVVEVESGNAWIFLLWLVPLGIILTSLLKKRERSRTREKSLAKTAKTC